MDFKSMTTLRSSILPCSEIRSSKHHFYLHVSIALLLQPLPLLLPVKQWVDRGLNIIRAHNNVNKMFQEEYCNKVSEAIIMFLKI